MSISKDHLYQLLPAFIRERDTASGGVLGKYLEVLTDELAVVADGIDQLYDDLFVETAAPWVLPYLADLVGLAGLPSSSDDGITPRAEVANTIAYRRRKGTASVLEQLARDTTGWPARAVEYFELLACCQHMNHVRTKNQATVDVRAASRLEMVGTAFERGSGHEDGPDLVHLVEMRRIPPHRGRYNIPNVGIHLWRLRAYPITETPAVPLQAGDVHRFLLGALGQPTLLFSSPIGETEITHLAEPVNVPMPFTRRLMAGALAAYYGPGLSLNIDGVGVDAVVVCDLSDDPANAGEWAHVPAAGQVLVDPVLGRLASGDARPAPPLVSYHYGFSADVGGGEYERTSSFAETEGPTVTVSQDGSGDHLTIASAIAAISAGGTVVVLDGARYDETPAITASTGAVELRAADGRRPTLVLDDELLVSLSGETEVSLNGLLIAGHQIRVSGSGRLSIRHSTLVPGRNLDAAGRPVTPGAVSLVIDSGDTEVGIERCILGALRGHVDADVRLSDCIVDATEAGVALASAPDAAGPAGIATFDQCTVLGRVHVRILDRASNSIFLARVPAGEEARWPGPVIVDRRQEGCVRFSSLPAKARTPRRYRCVPESDLDAAELRPVLASSQWGEPAYAQLDRRTSEAVRRGADDESEMGVFHHLHQPQREAYFEARLQEHLRFGLEAGLFFAT